MHITPVTDIPVVDIAIDTVKKKKQALIFVMSKRSAQKTALDIAKKKVEESDALKKLADTCLNAASTPTDQCKKLAQAILGGVAFHHAGLLAKQREAIEHAFVDGTLKLIACTPTLAIGMDMPAFRTILKDVKRFAPPWGMRYIPVLEYQQMTGRAGRPGKEEYGEAILIATSDTDYDKLVEQYINGDTEDIYSKLAAEPVLRMYVLSLLATRICQSEQGLIDFFSKTFWAHQYEDMQQLGAIIKRVLHLLESYEFIQRKEKTQDNMEFVSADALENHDTPCILVF